MEDVADLPGSRRAGLTTAVSAVTVALLLGLGALLAWSVVSISSTAADVAEARSRLAAYAGLQRAVGGEAFAEAGYRRAPGATTRERLLTSIEDVDTAIDVTRRTGTRRDGALLSYLKTVNDRYAHDVRSTLGQRPGKGTNDRVAGPALDSIQRLLDGAITGHRAEADRAAARQRAVLRNVTWMLPLVFLIALSSLVVVWRMLRREHRRLAALAARNDRRARTDGLTGLANRDGLAAAVARFDDADSALCLMVLDLDGFKPVNDTHGHAAGDDVLRQVAGRLRAAVRRADVVARLGGDEFAVLLADCDEPALVAEKILALLARPFRVGAESLRVGASIGLARAPSGSSDLPALLRRADAALYDAKAAGRGCVRVAADTPTAKARRRLARIAG